MKLYIPVLKKEEGKFFNYSESLELGITGFDVNSVMSIDLQATYLRPNVIIKGSWQIESKGECSRCLEQTVFLLKDSFYDEFNQLPNGENFVGDSVPIDMRNFVFRGDTLDLEEYFRQSFILSQPLKILCSNQCKGLCPVCGTDRNKGDCNCNQDNIDPRWALLQKIKEKP